jgi:PAS domain-containing protein
LEDSDAEAQVASELQLVKLFWERNLPGIASRWSGDYEVRDYALAPGVKEPNCNIILDRSILWSDFRWVVYSHEMLHSFSAGFEAAVYYERLRGWEEGVVESLERLLRPKLLDELQISFDHSVQAEAIAYEDCNDYNRYVDLLEALRRTLGYSDDADEVALFYTELLREHINRRFRWAMKSAMQSARGSHKAVRERMLVSVLAIDEGLRKG